MVPESNGVAVILRDKHLLVLNKPSGLSTTSPDGSECLTSIAKKLDPTAQRMHASSRLDAEVTGLVTFARTTIAIAALKEAREKGNYKRLYLGLAHQAPSPADGSWRESIAIDSRDPRKRVVAKAGAPSKEAHTDYRIRATTLNASLLELRPQTGRTHQLRVHASHAGSPLLGDVHYGGKRHITTSDGRVHVAKRVMLHCFELVLPRIDGTGTHTLRAEVPKDMRDLWIALGGDAISLD